MIPQQRRALVVDEELSWCETLHSQLTSKGITVEISDQLDSGLTVANQGNFDFIFLNDQILDTFTHKGRLQQLLETHPKQHVILVGDIPHWRRVREAFLLGVTDHIAKPIETTDVLSTLM